MNKTNTTNTSSSQAQNPSLRSRLAAPLCFALALCALVICCYDAGSEPVQLNTEQRYAQAKEEGARLRADDKRASKREHWERLAAEFMAVYDGDTTWPNRPAALFRAAECLEELASRTLIRKDAQTAAEGYEYVAKAHPQSQLADDALYRAAHIHAARLGDDKGALALIERLKKQYARGDMLTPALTLEKAILASRQGRTAPEAREVSRVQRPEMKEDTEEGKANSERVELAQAKPVATVASVDNRIPAPVTAPVTQETKKTSAPAPESVKAGVSASIPALHLVSWDSPTKNSVEIVLEMSAPARFSSRLIKNRGKASVVLDLDQVNILKELRKGARITGSLLTAIRVQQGRDGKAQLHFDFRDVRRFDTRKESDPCRIILSVAAGNTPLPRKNGANSGFAANEKQDTETAPQQQTVATADTNERLTPKADEATAVASVAAAPMAPLVKAVPAAQESKANKDAPVEDAPARKSAAQARPLPPLPLSRPELHRASVTSDMASQLGLSVQRVFIDAGHGGRDPGTAHNNVQERLVTHEVAQILGRLLKANGFEVVFSRERDNFVSLGERTALANDARADLFVSIHVNANDDRRVQGLETYFLDIARNKNAARVAALENAGSDRRLGDMQDMLAEVMLNARVGESRNLARDVQRATLYRLKKRDYPTRDSGVKSAPFHVLIGAQMPAVLVELGYCTNGEEAARLQDSAYRQALAEGLAEGIMAYQKRIQNLQTAER